MSTSVSGQWTRTLRERGYAVPVLPGDDVLVSFGGTGAGGLRRYPADGSARWTATAPGGPTGTPVVAGDVGPRGRSRRCPARTGRAGRIAGVEGVHGRRGDRPRPGGTTLFAGPAARREGFRVLDGRRLEGLGPSHRGRPGRTPTVAAGETVYARVSDQVPAPDLNGRERWTAPLGHSAGPDRHTPVVRGRRLCMPSGTGVAAADITR
ncbi:hypothetical protein GCM10010260_09210 [Streptomyces filipinensis]|uniref:Uncharacterized protein n=1 Tax=Streptomyces filipinensis TaxID=66887 RepID=A0A918I5W4_9ACTN|nr:hypothetical protein [Streptomyces filipinensis]GGU78845.1 hypothetical protein GCM10010260_09210 [Streptomyces filipinensis]